MNGKIAETFFFHGFCWHPAGLGCILTVLLLALAGCGGGCERRADGESAVIAPETAEPVGEGEGEGLLAEPENWRTAAPVRERLILTERNRTPRKTRTAERTEALIRKMAEEAVRAVLLFPGEAVFAGPGMPGTGLVFAEPGYAVVSGWLIAPDETGRERRMRYRVRVHFERGIFVRAELPEVTVDAAGKGMP